MNVDKVDIPDTNYTVGRQGKKIKYVVLHWIVGTLSTADATFKNPSRKASAHYGVEGNKVHQYVEEKDTAWHAGNWEMNLESIGIEHSGGELVNGTRRKPSEQTHKTSAELVRGICLRYNIPIDREHIIKHNEVSATQCPGSLDIDYIIKLAQGGSDKPITPDERLPESWISRNEPKLAIEREYINKTDAYVDQIGKFTTQLDEALEDVKKLENTIKVKDDQIEEYKQNIEDLRKDIENKDGRITSLLKNIDIAESKIDELEDKIAKIESYEPTEGTNLPEGEPSTNLQPTMDKIQLSDVAKKHLKVIGYLALSGLLAYGLASLSGRPEAIYLTPVINYILYTIKQELSKEGVVQALRK